MIAAALSRCRHETANKCFQKAANYLAALLQPGGEIDPGPAGITYPVYAAAGAVIALQQSATPQHTSARDVWLNYLRQLQLGDSLGWQPQHLAYGGWSYAPSGPSPMDGKPPSPLAVPNLSATVFALGALRTAGCGSDDPAFRAARTFVERCQNWHDDPAMRDPRFDDGGFFFILEDPIRNKAGEAGSDASGRTRFRSYGSTTADGLQSLMACGYSPDHPRVTAARDWLTKNFSASEHPGRYAAYKAHARPAVYYYYVSSVADAFRQIDAPADWAKEIAHALLARQRSGGSWSNPVVDTREDDPLVATPLAMRALIACAAGSNSKQ
jgi:squalene-hopene/tetraprenyl-beta-curcumene cyclase